MNHFPIRKLSFILLITFCALSCRSPEDEPISRHSDQLIEDLRFLSSDTTRGRQTGTEGNRIAREYVINRFITSGVSPYGGQYEHPFDFTRREKEYTGVNIIGISEGRSDSMIVITAHYDHIGMRDSLIFNGADDNASGTAALLELAEYFSRTDSKHTLLFAVLDAEEIGLRGGRALAADSLIREKTILNINMDMIAQNKDKEIYAAGTYHNPFLRTMLEEIVTDTSEVKLLFGHDRPDSELNDWTYSSDHAAFHDAGIPFIYFGVEDHPFYHRHTDEFDTIPTGFYRSVVDMIRGVITELDKML